jgi:hypothetical protein
MSDSLSWNASIITSILCQQIRKWCRVCKVWTSDLLSGEYSWQAVSFVRSQADEELWEELINQSMHNPAMIGSLLENTVGHIDPLHVVDKVPAGMPIPRLRDRLVKIITDYRTETSLRAGCNDILKADCVNLLVRYYDEAHHAIRVGGSEFDTGVRGLASANGGESKRANGASTSGGKGGSKGGRTPNSIGGSGRCCICFDPLALQKVAVVAFFCTHAYHETCLHDTSGIVNSEQERDNGPQKSGSGMNETASDPRESNGDLSNPAPLCCILCTTAASTKRKSGVNGFERTVPMASASSPVWGSGGVT